MASSRHRFSLLAVSLAALLFLVVASSAFARRDIRRRGAADGSTLAGRRHWRDAADHGSTLAGRRRQRDAADHASTLVHGAGQPAGLRRRRSPQASPSCMKLDLKSYTKAVKLRDGGKFLLHWNITKANDRFIAAIEAKKGSGAEASWMSIGWTKTAGKAFPSDVVVGNHVFGAAIAKDVVAYSMMGNALKVIKQTKAVMLTKPSTGTTADGGTIVK
ncbi:unnamed protein product [Closterium sp. Naga37s-1]|nr:unnamed protein product [Closterium sp. Naga37s-1]